MELIITFKSTNQAIKAELALLQQNIQVCVMPLPPQIRAGCGICIRVQESDIHQAWQTLHNNAITDIEVFQKENGAFSKVGNF